MTTAINLFDAGLYYRVRHPEFEPNRIYRAIAYIDYGESAWAQLLFVNERGMTYAVRVWRAFCVNHLAGGGLSSAITDPAILEAPWPRPRCKNPDLDDDR